MNWIPKLIVIGFLLVNVTSILIVLREDFGVDLKIMMGSVYTTLFLFWLIVLVKLLNKGK